MTLCLTKCLSDFQEPFLRERRYLKNVTPKTITWYQSSFKAFSAYLKTVKEGKRLTNPC
jgi:hypothetical protein